MNDVLATLRSLARQEQFLEAVGRDEAITRFHRHLDLRPLGSERLPFGARPGPCRAPSSPRSTFPALTAPMSTGSRFAPTIPPAPASGCRGAWPFYPEILTPGKEPLLPVIPGTAALIATGGMVPRGADAVVMVEHTEAFDSGEADTIVEIRRPAAAGQFICFAGSDLARGETVLRAGQMLTSREIGMLAAVGCADALVWRQPRVADPVDRRRNHRPGHADAPRRRLRFERRDPRCGGRGGGGIPQPLGIGADDEALLSRLVDDGARIVRHGGPLRRHLEGCRRSLLSRHRPL